MTTEKANPTSRAKATKNVPSTGLHGIIKKLNAGEITPKQGKEYLKLCNKHLKKIDSVIARFEKDINKAGKKMSKARK